MDPLTITSTVISISARCIHTAKAIYDLRERYKHAGAIITSIYSQSTLISAALGNIQGLICKSPAAIQTTLQSRNDLEKIFDQALTGCVMVYSVLDDEIQKLYAAPDSVQARMQTLWKEQTMKNLLQELQGQQAALSFLLQTFQMSLQMYVLSYYLLDLITCFKSFKKSPSAAQL
jgi:ABC-type transporter Mla subunit MlaD